MNVNKDQWNNLFLFCHTDDKWGQNYFYNYSRRGTCITLVRNCFYGALVLWNVWKGISLIVCDDFHHIIIQRKRVGLEEQAGIEKYVDTYIHVVYYFHSNQPTYLPGVLLLWSCKHVKAYKILGRSLSLKFFHLKRKHSFFFHNMLKNITTFTTYLWKLTKATHKIPVKSIYGVITTWFRFFLELIKHKYFKGKRCGTGCLCPGFLKRRIHIG